MKDGPTRGPPREGTGEGGQNRWERGGLGVRVSGGGGAVLRCTEEDSTQDNEGEGGGGDDYTWKKLEDTNIYLLQT